MATIGTFKKTDNGFVGSIETLNLKIKDVAIVPAAKTKETSPDYAVKVGGYELGVGWLHLNRNGKEYVSVKLDDPSFSSTLSASLFEQQDHSFALIWSR